MEAQQSRDRYLNLYEYAPVGYFTLDKDSRILEVNLTGSVMLGEPRSGLVKTDFNRFIVPEFLDTFYFHLNNVLETGSKQSSGLKIKKQDGSLMNVLVNSAARVDSEGRLSQCFSTITDITIEKQSEALKESEEKYRTLFEDMVSGFALHELVFDKAGKPIDYITIEANREYERLLNTKKEDVIGKRAYELIPDLDKEWLEIFSQVVLTGEPKWYIQYASNEAANASACRMFGRTEEELRRVGRNEVVDKTDPRLQSALEERARSGRFKGELNHIRKDGTFFPGEVSTSFFTDKDGLTSEANQKAGRYSSFPLTTFVPL